MSKASSHTLPTELALPQSTSLSGKLSCKFMPKSASRSLQQWTDFEGGSDASHFLLSVSALGQIASVFGGPNWRGWSSVSGLTFHTTGAGFSNPYWLTTLGMCWRMGVEMGTKFWMLPELGDAFSSGCSLLLSASSATEGSVNHHKCLASRKIWSLEELETTCGHKAKDITSHHELPGGERHGKRKHSILFLERMREGHCQSDETLEMFPWQRWGKLLGGGVECVMGFSEHLDTILNWKEGKVPRQCTERKLPQHLSANEAFTVHSNRKYWGNAVQGLFRSTCQPMVLSQFIKSRGTDCSLCSNTIICSGPCYLSELLHLYGPFCYLHSSSDTAGWIFMTM